MTHFKPVLLFLLVCIVRITAAQDLNFTTKLPIVFINTNGKEIPDDPKIIAEMSIVWNENGQQNSTQDEANHYKGKIGIETRGSSSQSFPKKAFGFELRDNNNEDMDFGLLGLPEEEDWILYAPFSDKTLIRNVLTFSLAASLNAYTPRCRFVELFLNNKYWGVYVLMEKVKRDKHRVDINKLKEDETSGEDVTGGYIIKIDKTTGNSGPGWHSGFENRNGARTYYQFEYPKYDKIVAAQKAYIMAYVDDFESAVHEQNFDASTGYASYINKQSFIDYIVMNELSKNVDGYRLSTFLYKDKNEKLNAGPLWDFNLAYGNANYNNAWETAGMQMFDDAENPFWWEGLTKDENFANELRCNWEQLRENELSGDRIRITIDSLSSLLTYAAERNFNRWSVMGKYVWPNYFVGHSFSHELIWMKMWISDRLTWLDFSMPGDCSALTTVTQTSSEHQLSVFPNPLNNTLYIKLSSKATARYTVQVSTLSGQTVLEQQGSVVPGQNLLKVNTSSLLSGVFICTVREGNNTLQSVKIIKR
jgi:hypothetical protein